MLKKYPTEQVAYWRRILTMAERHHGAMGTLSHDQDEDELREAIKKGYKFSTSEVIRCNENINLWQRISRLVAKIKDLSGAECMILNGWEDELRMYWRAEDKTRVQLLAEARSLNVRNYGKLTKKELKVEIARYQRDKITRQRFERKR